MKDGKKWESPIRIPEKSERSGFKDVDYSEENVRYILHKELGMKNLQCGCRICEMLIKRSNHFYITICYYRSNVSPSPQTSSKRVVETEGKDNGK